MLLVCRGFRLCTYDLLLHGILSMPVRVMSMCWSWVAALMPSHYTISKHSPTHVIAPCHFFQSLACLPSGNAAVAQPAAGNAAVEQPAAGNAAVAQRVLPSPTRRSARRNQVLDSSDSEPDMNTPGDCCSIHTHRNNKLLPYNTCVLVKSWSAVQSWIATLVLSPT